jgi:aminoglycoside 6-adenylyltransferase
MKSLQDIQADFTAWAQANDDVRAAFVVGSQARADHPADEWADLDIILFARNVERYQNATDWLAAFAPVWIALAGRTVAGDPERLVLFEGGAQVDFVFHSSDVLSQVPQMLASGNIPDTIRRGARVLLDKDGALTQMPAPSRPPAPQPPDAVAFREALDNFWFLAVYSARQLRRGELWLFQNSSGGMQWRLLQMTEWRARAVHGGEYDTWHGGKFIAEWAGADVYADLRRTFAHLDRQDSWQALQARLEVFHRLAQDVATQYGLPYPTELAAQIGAYVAGLQRGAHTVTPEQIFRLEPQTVMLADFPADGFILDIGGGGEGLIGQLKPGQVVAIDVNRRELEEAGPGALKIVMDAGALHFLDGAFDAATACFALMFIPAADHPRVLAEVFRVLAPGGRFLIWDADVPTRPADVPAAQRIVAFALTVHLPEQTVETGYGTPWPSQAYDLAYYTHLAQTAGFEIVEQAQQGRVLSLVLRKP